MKFKYANKYTAGLMRIDRTFYKVQKKYKKYLTKLNIETSVKEKSSDYLWFCWMQGINNAPELVKKCYEKVLKNFKNKKIILITDDNFSDYVEIPEFIIKKRNKRNYNKYSFFRYFKSSIIS